MTPARLRSPCNISKTFWEARLAVGYSNFSVSPLGYPAAASIDLALDGLYG